MQFLRAARFAQRPHPRLLPQRIALLLTGLLVAGMLPGAAGCGVAAEHAPGGEPSATTLPSAGNGAHHAGVTLADGALRVVAAHGGAWQLGLRWTGLGRASRVARVASPDGEARVAEDRASYLREDGS